MSVTINTISGSTTVAEARVVDDSVTYALRHERDETKIVAMGDRLANPNGLTIDFFVQEATIGETAEAVDDLIAAARGATSVDTWRGNRAVYGALRIARSSTGHMVTVTVTFAPQGAGYT